MRNLSQAIIYKANASLTVDSNAIDCSQIYAVSLQANFSSNTLEGNLVLQGSNDLTTPTNWSNIDSETVTTGSVTLIPTTQICYQFIRAQWVPTAGSGTVTININSQGF
jgi:hypothetical protein